MYEVDASVVIDRPIEVVFENATCLRGCVAWSAGLKQTEQLTAVEGKVGSRFKHVTGYMGNSSTQYLTITKYNAPHEFEAEDQESGHKFVTRFVFNEVPEGTRIDFTLSGAVSKSLLGKLTEPVVAAGIKRLVQNDLVTLKTLLENDVRVVAN